MSAEEIERSWCVAFSRAAEETRAQAEAVELRRLNIRVLHRLQGIAARADSGVLDNGAAATNVVAGFLAELQHLLDVPHVKDAAKPLREFAQTVDDWCSGRKTLAEIPRHKARPKISSAELQARVWIAASIDVLKRAGMKRREAVAVVKECVPHHHFDPIMSALRRGEVRPQSCRADEFESLKGIFAKACEDAGGGDIAERVRALLRQL